MRTFARVVSAGSVALAVGIAGVPASHAATTGDVFSAWAGGTTVHLLGGAIYSDQTSNTGVTSTELDQHSTNQLARVDAPGIASVGVVTTSADSTAISGGGPMPDVHFRQTCRALEARLVAALEQAGQGDAAERLRTT